MLTCAQIQYYQIKFDFLLLGLWLTGLAIRIMSQKRNVFYALVYQSLESVFVSPVIMICTNIQTRLFQFLHSLQAIPVWNDENFIHTISYSDFLCYQFHINFHQELLSGNWFCLIWYLDHKSAISHGKLDKIIQRTHTIFSLLLQALWYFLFYTIVNPLIPFDSFATALYRAFSLPSVCFNWK